MALDVQRPWMFNTAWLVVGALDKTLVAEVKSPVLLLSTPIGVLGGTQFATDRYVTTKDS